MRIIKVFGCDDCPLVEWKDKWSGIDPSCGITETDIKFELDEKRLFEEVLETPSDCPLQTEDVTISLGAPNGKGKEEGKTEA